MGPNEATLPRNKNGRSRRVGRTGRLASFSRRGTDQPQQPVAAGAEQQPSSQQPEPQVQSSQQPPLQHPVSQQPHVHEHSQRAQQFPDPD